MKITVIVPVKDDPPVFACVESLLRCERGDHLVEFLVVDNGSTAEFAASLAALTPSVTVLGQPKPGQAAARNTAIAAASGDVLFFTDADCRVDPGWLLRGVEGCERTDAPILRGHSGAVLTTAASRAIESSFRWREQWTEGQTVNVDTKNLAVRREVFEVVRFNEAALRAEDVEFGRMAANAGFRCAYWPTMRIDHEHESRLDVFLAKKVCGGWTGQRVVSEIGDRRGRRGRRIVRLAMSVRPRWLRDRAIRTVIWTLLRAGTATVGASRILPTRVTGELVRFLTLASLSMGNVLFLAGFPQPRFRDVLQGRYEGPPAAGPKSG